MFEKNSYYPYFSFYLQNGAKYLYLTTKHNILKDEIDLNDLTLPKKMYVMSPNVQHSLFYVSTHYGEVNPNRAHNGSYSVYKRSQPEVLQIMRSADKTSYGIPDIVLPLGVISATHYPTDHLYYRNSFWGLLLFPSFEKKSYIYRSIILQKLLQVTHGQYGYFQLENFGFDHSIDATEMPIKRFLEDVVVWQPRHHNIKDDFLGLVNAMKSKGHFSEEDEKFANWWLRQLGDTKCFSNLAKSGDIVNILTDVVYHPPIRYLDQEHEQASRKDNLLQLTQLCPQTNTDIYERKMTRDIYDDIQLLISYNVQDTDNLPILKTIHNYRYPHTVFCAPGKQPHTTYATSFLKTAWYDKEESASHVSDCLVKAIRMNYKVKGLLHISDDVAIFPWNLKDLNRTKIWKTNDELVQSIIADPISQMVLDSDLNYVSPIPNWISKYQHTGVREAFLDMKTFHPSSSVGQCYTKLMDKLKSPYRFYFEQSDIFYVPKHLLDTFADVLEVFFRNGVFFEIAIPTAFRCIMDEQPFFLKWMHISPQYRHYKLGDFGRFTRFHYMHPYKFSVFMKNQTLMKNIFCDKIANIYFKR